MPKFDKEKAWNFVNSWLFFNQLLWWLTKNYYLG